MPPPNQMPLAMDPGSRVNPFTGGLFLAPSQYQELMQQYFQSLMMQAGGQIPPFPIPQHFEAQSGVSNQSPSPPLAAFDPNLAALAGLATLNLGQLNLASSPPASAMATCVPQANFNSRHSTPSKVSSVSVGIGSNEASANCSSSPSPSFNMMPTESKDLILDDLMNETKETPSETKKEVPEQVQKDLDQTNTEDSKPAEAKEKKTEESELESEKPKRKFDARADELFRKQMHEIEQEINRRIQNRNVRKLNEEELTQLLNDTGFGNFVEAGKPSSEVSEQMGHLIREPSPPPVAAKPSLNQLRSSFTPPKQKTDLPDLMDSFQPKAVPISTYPFNFGSVQMAQPPPEPLNSTFPSSAMYPIQQQQPATVETSSANFIPGFDTPATPPENNVLPNPATITPEVAAMLLKKVQESNPGLLKSLGLVAADQVQNQKPKDDPEAFRLPAPPSAINPVANRQRIGAGSMPSTSATVPDNGWEQIRSNGENGQDKENTGQEPIWVMRDSYLKRLQREEQRSKEMQNGAGPSNGLPDLENENDDDNEQRKLLNRDHNAEIEEHIKATKKPSAAKKEVMVHEPAVLIEGVLFRARYLGSTQLTCDGRPTKSSRMAQAQEAVARVKAPDGEIQPSTEIDLFISTEKIMVLNTDLQDILMDHALRSISYIADIGDVVVLMARRMPQGSTGSDEEDSEVRKTPRVVCHVFESDEASFIAQSIGQAFQVAYVEFLRANGIDDPSYLREIDYQEVLNSQELLGEELDLFADKKTQKDVVVSKKVGEALGIVVVESGWGSMLPTVVIAMMEPHSPASRSNKLNIGDQIIAINGNSLVGLPLAKAQQHIKNAKTSTAVRLTVVSTPPVVEVRIKRPDTKYQLGFSVQNGVICSLLRGGIAERGGIRVGHRIIWINDKSVVNVPHEKIVNMLATATGVIHMKTMPTSMFRLLTGQEVPNYI
uniref:Uncharacterized protein n=1 Tax=Panagrolaimus sp. JU765 TaxID=591449 RepID=A0AC34RK60_9BILA